MVEMEMSRNLLKILWKISLFNMILKLLARLMFKMIN